MPEPRLEPQRVYKVALFGVTGCGKSSIVNLLAEEQMAEVSTGVEACTTRARWYPISLGEKKFRLWDTMGFNQAEAGGIDPLFPYQQAHTLLENLQEGVDLVLLCARKDAINASLHGLYWLLDSLFFRGEAQIALVLTHFDTPDDTWWDRNRNVIAKRCGMPAVQFPPHIGITAVPSGSSDSDAFYEQSRTSLRALLQEHATAPTPLRLDLSGDAARDTALEGLKTHCQLSIDDATELLRRFCLPRQPFRTILFGEAGVGKSSIINLAIGANVADGSDGIKGCAMDYRCYEINTGRYHFLAWDTVGFNTYIEHSETEQAIGNAVHLIRDLHQQGGVDLLVFCKRGGRLTGSELSVFRLFRECLCEGQIPVAFIITHLESLTPMEEWWEENGGGLLKACDLSTGSVAGHACITALAPEDPEGQRHLQKVSLSRQLVHAMLEDSISCGSGFIRENAWVLEDSISFDRAFIDKSIWVLENPISYGNAFIKDESAWVMSFLRRLVGLVKVGRPSRKTKITAKNLIKRCGLSQPDAEELIEMLYGQR